MKKNILLPVLLLLATLSAFAQKEWTLKSNKDGIKVFTRTEQTSGLKEIRVQCQVPATLSQMVALVMDVNAGKDWVYATKSSTLLKTVSPSELYYYSEVDMPWPLNNRDFIAHLIVSQHPQSHVVTIDGPTVGNYVAEKEDIVRVKRSSGKWTLSPVAENLVHVDYTLSVDPGGNIPIWLVNLFATKGPTETFRKLKTQITKPVYARVKLPYIVD
ncbi:MAG: START domain-containing protein [Chitinophagaceae bacterium]